VFEGYSFIHLSFQFSQISGMQYEPKGLSAVPETSNFGPRLALAVQNALEADFSAQKF
jgi:predicted N-acyltransferase